MRLLIIKYFRTFRRDPAQWFQILIFVLMATLYFFNMRSFYERDIGRAFQNGISLLTLAATAFLMCAYTGRFIFPMLSLEGKKFWILGLLPMKRDYLLWAMYAFSATGTLLVAEFLVVFSNWMLNMPWQIILVHAATVAVLSSALSGLSVGLGACMPNFRESDPSKIAVGFGGTLNLVASLLILVVVILMMAVPAHLLLRQDARSAASWPAWFWLGMLAGACVGALATLLPLRAGIRAMRRMEF
jgi:ABC-2 type transport system permease protein